MFVSSRDKHSVRNVRHIIYGPVVPNLFLVATLFSFPKNVGEPHTPSGRTGSALVWHSEGRTIEADSVEQVL